GLSYQGCSSGLLDDFLSTWMTMADGYSGRLISGNTRIPHTMTGFSALVGWWNPPLLGYGTNFFDGPLQCSSCARASAACLLFKLLDSSQDGLSTEAIGVIAGCSPLLSWQLQ